MDYAPFYAGSSQVQSLGEGGQRLRFAPDLGRREKPALRARALQPLTLRDALLTLYGVLSSERKQKRDRNDYLQYLARTGGSGSAADKKAQADYLAEISKQEPETSILDPVVTVHPDEVAFEVFSKDESTYARLSLRKEALEDLEPRVFGSTTVEFSQEARAEISKIRSYYPLELCLGGAQEAKETSQAPSLRIADSWMRAFLQVQSASLLAGSSTEEVLRFGIEPVDLYNVLVFLRLHSTRTSPRALRYELIPGERVRLVLEPWGESFYSPLSYAGKVSQAVRTWGRARLRLLERLLPLAKKIEVVLLGTALPSFYVLDLGGGITFTLGLSGWTANDWSQGALFDLMVGWDEPSGADLARVSDKLEESHCATLEELKEVLGPAPSSPPDDRAARALRCLQAMCRKGLVTYDIASGQFRYRRLAPLDLDPKALRFRSEEEALAYKLLEGRGVVEITERTEVRGQGLAVAGRVIDREENRSYQVSFMLDTDGRMRKLRSEGPAFRDASGAKGPDAYLMALRLYLGKLVAQEKERQRSAEGRSAITEEVRTLRRRNALGEEEIYRVSLERDTVEVQWGPARGKKRHLRLYFNSLDEAREAYFARLEMQRRRGFLEEG